MSFSLTEMIVTVFVLLKRCFTERPTRQEFKLAMNRPLGGTFIATLSPFQGSTEAQKGQTLGFIPTPDPSAQFNPPAVAQTLVRSVAV